MGLKKRTAVLGIITALIIGGTINSVSAANSGNPGTSADPLVTKSYVDDAISNLLGALSTSETSGAVVSADSSFMPVKVTKGQLVIGKEGAEIILRGGTAVSYCSGVDGIIDVTTGQEYFNGTNLELNHLVIVPRADGRGASVTSDEAWFIIKGGYEIQ